MARIISFIARWSARVGGLLVLVMAFIIGIDILSRRFFSYSILSGGAGEISGYVLAISCAWGAALTLLNRAHIRIDIAQSIVPNKAWVILDLISITFFCIAAGILAYVGYATFSESYARNAHSMSPLSIPMAIPQGIWALGLIFLFITSLYLLTRSIYLVLSGRTKEASGLISNRTAQEDLDEQKIVVQKDTGVSTDA